MLGFVYCVTNSVNGKQYIGQTIRSIVERWRYHVRDAKLGSMCALHCAIRKYGVDAFAVEQLDSADSLEELNCKEAHYIGALQTFAPAGYNVTTGGDSFEHSVETCRKISETHLGKVVSEETRQRISAAQRGKIVSEETRQRISDARSRVFYRGGSAEETISRVLKNMGELKDAELLVLTP